MKFTSANRAKHFNYSVICSLLPAFLFSVSISLSLFPLIQAFNTFLFFQDHRHKKDFQDYTVTLKALLTIYLIFRRRESHPPSNLANRIAPAALPLEILGMIKTLSSYKKGNGLSMKRVNTKYVMKSCLNVETYPHAF